LTLLRSATTRPPTIWLSTTNCSSYPAAITLAAVVRAARITPDLTRVATFATGRAVRIQAQRVIPSICMHADAAIRSPASPTGTAASPSFSSSSAAPCALADRLLGLGGDRVSHAVAVAAGGPRYICCCVGGSGSGCAVVASQACCR
jgi:hypothetical protein